MARHNNVKIYNTFYQKKLHVLFATIPVNVQCNVQVGIMYMNYA